MRDRGGCRLIEIAVALALMFALFCGALVVIHGMQLGRLTLLDWALLAIGGMYGLGWILVLGVTQAGGNPTWAHWINPFASLYWVHTLCAFLLVGGVLGGWYLPGRLLPIARPDVGLARESARRWTRAFWLVLLAAVLLQGLYTRALGGYLGVFEYSSAIRSALFSEVPANPLSFLQPFGGMAMVAASGFFGLWLDGRRTSGVLLGLSLSFCFSLYVLYSWLGRLNFVIFLVTFVLGQTLHRRPRPLPLVLWGAVLFLVTLGSAYGVSVWLNLKAADSFGEFLARELAFPFGSFFAQLSVGEHLFRGFVDFIVTPIYFLPSSWWTGWYEPVSQVNTAVVMGAPKGEGGTTGSIPVDLLTLGLMQLHVPGVLLVGLLFGLLLRVLQYGLARLSHPGVRAVLEAFLALRIAALGVSGAQPELVVSGNFGLIASGVLIALYFAALRITLFSCRHVRVA